MYIVWFQTSIYTIVVLVVLFSAYSYTPYFGNEIVNVVVKLSVIILCICMWLISHRYDLSI